MSEVLKLHWKNPPTMENSGTATMVEDNLISSGNKALHSTANKAVGKDMTGHISLSYLPARTPSLQTTVLKYKFRRLILIFRIPRDCFAQFSNSRVG